MTRPTYDLATCPDCGYTRPINTPRGDTPTCVDCRWLSDNTQPPTNDLGDGRWFRDGLTWRWEPDECCPDAGPMCADCRRWAEQRADDWFWRRWEKANRLKRQPSVALRTEAEQRAKAFPTPFADHDQPQLEGAA